MTETQALNALLAGALPPALYRCSSRIRATTLTRRAEAHGWRVYWLDGRAISNKTEILSRAAETLRFPNYFGYNWDALEECLNDMAEGPALLLFDYASRFAAAAPDDFATTLEILATVAANRRDGPAPLAVLVRGGGRATAHLPVVEI